MDATNQGVGVNLNSMNSSSFRQLSAKSSDNKNISLHDLDASVQSVQDDIEFDMKPQSSFQFFKNQEIPVFNYDMMSNNFTDG